MKKTVVILFAVCIVFAVGAFYDFNASSPEGQEDIQTLFGRWDKGEVEDSEKTSIMNALADSLRRNPQLPTEEIEALSHSMSVYEAASLRVIEYIENPEFYGNSGKESFHLVAYNGRVETIDSRGSMQIEEIKPIDERLYYVYATDYRVSNLTGIRIFKMEMDDSTIHRHSLINKDGLAEHLRYDEASEVLYDRDGHIYFKEIRDNGHEVVVTAGDADYLLQVGEPL